MLRLDQIASVREVCDERRRAGQRIGFVPTMGYFHEGHLSLMRRARELSDFVLVSIFVNPLQFGPSEDLARYPRDLEADLAKCQAERVDLVFTPSVEEMYGPGFQSVVEVRELSQGLCGAHRPGHFRGVTTVVTKLLNIVGPCSAVFGEKDFQQLQVVRQMVADLSLPAQVVASPIVREPDGLAMSSRNVFLQPADRAAALCLSRALRAVAERVAREGPLPADEAVAMARRMIEAEPRVQLEYLEARDARMLRPVERVGGGASVLAVAARVGSTRLIDNTRL